MRQGVRHGVILPQTEIGPDPDVLTAFAETAEASGFDYLEVYDHVLGADSESRPGWDQPYDANDQFHEPLVTFGFLAAKTRLELVTGILVLPQRQTALVAKQAAEVDILTGGRFRLGVGIGWNEVEYEGLGVDFGIRSQIYEEQIEVLRLLWTHDVVSFEGRFHKIDAAGILPRPIQRPIPIWMGGAAIRRVLERIGRLGDGWLAVTAPGHGLEEAWDVIVESAEKAGRDPGSVGLEGRVEPHGEPSEDKLRRQLDRWYAFEATTHISVSGLHGGRSPREHVEFVKRAGEVVFG